MSQVLNTYGSARRVAGVLPRPRTRAETEKLATFAALATATILAVACFSCYCHTREELRQASAERNAEASRVEKLRDQAAAAGAELEQLRTDPKLIESLARESLGVVRRGDIVIRIDQSLPADSLPRLGANSPRKNAATDGRPDARPARGLPKAAAAVGRRKRDAGATHSLGEKTALAPERHSKPGLVGDPAGGKQPASPPARKE